METLTPEQARTQAQESEPALSRICEVTVKLKLVRWLPGALTLKCKRPAVWCSINLCCGSRSGACDMHKSLADRIEVRPKGGWVRCGECGQQTHFIWSRIR